MKSNYRVGTLTYTAAGLFALFAWLLWGDLCFYLHEYVVGGVMPLVFKRHHAPNWLMGVMLMTIPAAINFTIMPIVSTASDRTRTRWGRRLPYLAIGAPLNAIFLILLAFSEDLGRLLHRGAVGRWLDGSPDLTIIVVVAIAYIFFRLTDTVVASIYYYLFNDVVPQAVMARFLALFRVVGALSAAAYNAWIYQYSETHMREICLLAGLLYLFGYTLMCLRVREGAYPPPPAGMGRKAGFVEKTAVYFKETFTQRFYWYFFIFNGALAMGNAITSFSVFLQRDALGLTLAQIGRINSVCGLGSAALLYFGGMLADRAHPVRLMLLAVALETLWSVASLNWLCWNPTPHQALVVTVIIAAGAMPLSVMHTAASIPMAMRLLPAERLGQFWAANGMVTNAAALLGGALAGAFLDWMKAFNAAPNFCYRFIPVWQLGGLALACAMLYLLYREWLRLGGREKFAPPAAAANGAATAAVAGNANAPFTTASIKGE